jgi:hypothetical protein
MREYLNDETKEKFDGYLRAAVKGGCDLRQAEQIAKERTLFDVMRVSACIAAARAGDMFSNAAFVPKRFGQ